VPKINKHFRKLVLSAMFENLLKLSETLHKLHSHTLIHWIKPPNCRLSLQGYEFILSAKIWWEKTGDDCLVINLERAPFFCPDKGPHLAHIHTRAFKPQVQSIPAESHRKLQGKPWFPTTIRYYHGGSRRLRLEGRSIEQREKKDNSEELTAGVSRQI